MDMVVEGRIGHDKLINTLEPSKALLDSVYLAVFNQTSASHQS